MSQQNTQNILANYKEQLALEPNNYNILNNIGCIYAANNNFNEAIKYFEQSYEINSNNADVCNNLGNIYFHYNDYIKACIYFEEAITINPHLADPYNNLSVIYLKQNKTAQAKTYAEQAIKLNPTKPDFYCNLTNCHINDKSYDNGIKILQDIYDNFSDHYGINYNLGKLFQFKNYLIDAIYFLIKATNLAHTPHQSIKALTTLIFVKLQACDWDELNILKQELEKLIVNNLTPNTSFDLSPFEITAIGLETQAVKLAVSAKANIIMQQSEKLPKLNYKNKKPKIGYISPDFRQHPVGLIIQESLKLHDKSTFEIICFYTSDIYDRVTEEIKNNSDEFVCISELNALQAAKQVQKYQIDFLIDLSGYTENSCLSIMAHRPAPIQAHTIGYLNSLHSDFIDFYITDKHLCNNGNIKQHFKESLLLLPKSNLINIKSGKKNTKHENDKFHIGCFSKAYRLSQEIIDCWITILQKTTYIYLTIAIESVSQRSSLQTYFKLNNVNPDRVFFIELSHNNEVYDLPKLDLYLDTYPISGATMTNMALSNNIPVINLYGNNPESRASKSILDSLNLFNLTFNNSQQYIEFIVSIANSNSEYQALVKSIEINISNYSAKDTISALEHNVMELIT